MKRIIIVFLIITIALGIYFHHNKQREKIKIGIITMTSGNLAYMGDMIVKSALLASGELGRESDIEFIVEDVGNLDGQGTAAVAAARKLIDVDGVHYIIDGLTANGILAIAPILDARHVPSMRVLTGGQNIDEAGEYVFRNGPSNVLNAQQMASDFQNHFHFTHVAMVTDNGDYTLDLQKHFKLHFTGKLVADEVVSPDGNDYKTVVAKIATTNPDSIIINSATGVSARYLIKQIRESGTTAPIFTNYISYGPDLFNVAGKYAEGVYVYYPLFNSDSPEVIDFLKKFEAKYGFKAPIAFQAIGTHDALLMGLSAVDSVGYDGRKIHDYLLSTEKFQGLAGEIHFDESGNAGAGFEVMQIINSELQPVF